MRPSFTGPLSGHWPRQAAQASPGAGREWLQPTVVRQAVRDLDPDVAPYWVSPMEEVLARATTSTRFLAILLVALAASAIPALRASRVDSVEALRHE